MAAERDRRSNAGARMARLLEAEDDDDFYKTTYGGFTEEADDNDYQSEASVGSDGTDSDIDLDENDEVKSDKEDDDETKRKKRLVTKAYKEPKKASTTEEALPKTRTKVEQTKPEKAAVQSLDTSIEKKSLRKSTAEKSKSTEGWAREREAKAAMLRQIAEKKKVAEVRRLTQEELLAEARITEEINLRSLETYQKLELEKKKGRFQRQAHSGPFIRYHSVTVPLVDDQPDMEINVDSEPPDSDKPRPPARPTEKCSRTLITFSEERLFRKYFPMKRPRPAVRQFCPVTGLPAKYFDPVTKTPYATAHVFKLLREEHEERVATEKRVLDGPESAKRRIRTVVLPPDK